jgi:cytochrome c-type biogenesis protein CcmF
MVTLTLGTALLGTAAFGSVFTTVLLAAEYAADERWFPQLTRALSAVTSLSLVAALVYLTVQFVTGDYSNAYVWENTANYLPLLYKITGVYASNEGSILLWAMLASVVATVTVLSSRFEARGARLVQALAMGVVSVFAVMLVADNPFTPLSTAFPEVAANGIPRDGTGLNPLLVDPFMAIHPPITFSSYALLVVPFALGVTHFVARLRGHESPFTEWVDSTTRWLRLSWVLLTTAITLGGIWAYRVLGWGGFWSWDPVETAVLIPWLGLTAVVHTLNRYRRTGDYRILAPAATAVLFPLVVYATTVVRSGVFRSVHSFATGGIGGGVLFLLGSTGLIALVPAGAYWFQETTDDAEAESFEFASLLERATIYHAAVLGFVALAFVSLWGLTFPLLRNVISGVEVSVEARYYNLWSFPIVVFLLFVGGLYAQSEVLSDRQRVVGLGVAVAATAAVGVGLARPEWTLANPEPFSPLYYRTIGGLSAFAIVPPATYFGLSWLGRFVSRARRLRSRRVRLKEGGVALIHVGAATLIVAVTLVYVLSTTGTVGIAGATTLNESTSMTADVGNTSYTVEVSDYRTANTPTVTEAALSPAEVRATDTSVAGVLVRGRITAIERYENGTIAQVDDSSVWLGADEDSSLFENGTEVVARGSLSNPRSPNIDRLVYTNDRNMGTVNDPPENVHRPRVVDHLFHVQLYQGGSLVAEGDVAEQSYRRSEMRTNDALIERGALGDTYVVTTMTQDGISVRVSRFPLANQIWLGVGMMLLGMTLVFVFDPASGAKSS